MFLWLFCEGLIPLLWHCHIPYYIPKDKISYTDILSLPLACHSDAQDTLSHQAEMRKDLMYLHCKDVLAGLRPLELLT